MESIKRITSFMWLNIDGVDKIVFTFSEFDASSGKELINNEKRNFYIVDESVAESIENIKNYILRNQLGNEKNKIM